MSVDLGSLILDLTGLDDTQVEALGREHYSAAYIDEGSRGIRLAHDEETVLFHKGRFDHAFFVSKDWRFSDEKGRIDTQRVERVRWIGEIIRGNVPGSDCWLLRQNVTKRLYRVRSKDYVVWLDKYEADHWTFSTAFTASPAQLKRFVERETCIWRYGQKNTP
jgi:hypothetical protein